MKFSNKLQTLGLLLAILPLFVSAQTAKEKKYSIEQYLNIRSASAPTFSPTGDRVAYLTNVTGTNQVWIVPTSGGEPKQLTNYEDNIGFVEFSPADDSMVFGKAAGGDENSQFFWMKSDGTGVKALTNDPKVRNNFGGWSEDGKRIFYASNKRNRNYFDIYAMEIPSGREEMILQQDGANSVAAVSKDGRKIIVSRSGVELSLDNDLYLLDAQTKQAVHLTPHTGAAQFGDVRFAPDGKSIFLATNKDREFYSLARMDLTTKEIRILDDSKWDVDSIAISDNGSMFAFTLNREGFSQLNIIQTAYLDRKPQFSVPASDGIEGGLEFSKDGSLLAYTFSSAKLNSDIRVADVKAKTVKQLTNSSRAGIPYETFVAPELIKYKSFDGREIPAWFYRPQAQSYFNDGQARGTSTQKTDLPVIVSVHGGPEGQERPGFNALYQYYLSRGYAVLATNVRGSTGYGKTYTHLDDVEKREDSVKDLAAAVDWLKTRGGADPKRIAVMGGSYGGYMTMAAVTLYPDLWAAAVNTVGIVNWETFLQRTSGYRRRQREVEYGRLDKDLEFLRRISPLARVDRIKTPLMVIHGKNDPRVPYTEAEQVVEALRKRGAVVEYKLFDDEGHGVSKLKNRLIVYPLVADFLDKHLKMK